MMNDLIVIMGRPNVGKSTLLNRLIKQRASITLDEPGMTRDLLCYPWEHEGHQVTLVDTGGVFLQSKQTDFFQDEIEKKVTGVLQKARLILFMTDVRDGVHPYDQQIAKQLQPYKSNVVLVVNKVDDDHQNQKVSDFYSLGFDKPLVISAAHGKGISFLRSRVFSGYDEKKKESDQKVPRLAILGQPNTGKSSLVNVLFGDDWVIVSDQAGTTRDVVRVSVRLDGEPFELLDTAGLRRKSKVKHPIEFFSGLRARQTIEEADICLVLVDAEQGLVQQDKRILQLILDAAKPLIVVINKWDNMPQEPALPADFTRVCVQQMPRLDYYPFCFISALKSDGIKSLVKAIKQVRDTAEQRVPTSELNNFVQRVLSRHQPPGRTGKLNRVYYGTQAEKNPPTFVFSVRDPDPIKDGYYRYVEKAIRQYFKGFEGVGMKLVFKRHHARKESTR